MLTAEQRGMVARHQHLVQEELYRLRKRPIDRHADEDLVQAANLALAEAVLSYDSALSRNPAEYFRPRIRGAMLNDLARTKRAAQKPARFAAKAGYMTISNTGFEGNPLIDSEDEIRSRLDARSHAVIAAMSLALGGILIRQDVEESEAERFDHARLLADLRAGMPRLPRQEQVVLDLLYLAGQSYDAVAKALNRTVRQVRTIERAGLNRLGQMLGASD